MAKQRLRPGSWKLVNGGGLEKFRIDNEWFELPGSSTVEFESQIMVVYDDTNVTAYRNPVKPQTIVSNIGSSLPSNGKRILQGGKVGI